MPHEDSIGSTEACRLLDVSRATLTRWAKSGVITPAMQLPGRNGALLFKRDDVEKLAAQRAVSA
ncbi:helix-turn-helix domain-containing protein [Rhodococcus sp. IC4_135]|nr:helix-turn-helix domain-containing protein [Rhodococcus qingshengii]MEA1795150.1 helix-turn-helix domain-containing protein [Rhodococcus qingshengii]NHP15305.1 helix-turn-helix domain-containing protein [Rhodococcus sp. IC4_135]